MDYVVSQPLCSFCHSPWSTNIYPPSTLRSNFVTSCMKPWSLSDGKNSRETIPDNNARHLVKEWANHLRVLRRNQGSSALTPKWIKRTPEQMVRYLEDDRNAQFYGKHVLAAVRVVRSMSGMKAEERNMRLAMSQFVGKLTFSEMCYVLKEQKSWREARDFFSWMKLQLSYRPDVIAYTVLLRVYGKVGKINLAEETFLEMLDSGCDPDEIACGTMLCCYAKWGRFKEMLSLYSALDKRNKILPTSAYNYMISSLQRKSIHSKIIELWKNMAEKRVPPDKFTFTLIINSFVKLKQSEEALKVFYQMRSCGHVPDEDVYSLLITSSTKESNWEKTSQLYDDMVSLKIVPSNFTCSSLITMYYKLQNYKEATALYEAMRRQNMKIDEVIYGLMIRVYGKLGRYDDGVREFEEAEKMGELKSEKTYLAMAQMHLNSGDSEKALSVVELMKSRKVSMSRFAYIVMLQCHVMKKELKSAENVFHFLSESRFPDAGSCSDMLNLYKTLNMLSKAEDLIGQIKANSVVFTEELFRIVVDMHYKEGDLRKVEVLLHEIDENKELKESKFYKTIKNVVYEDLESLKEIDFSGLYIMISLYLDDGKLSKVESLLESFSNNSHIGEAFIDYLVCKFLKEGPFWKLKKLYPLVTKRGIALGKKTSSYLAKLLGKHRNSS